MNDRLARPIPQMIRNFSGRRLYQNIHHSPQKHHVFAAAQNVAFLAGSSSILSFNWRSFMSLSRHMSSLVVVVFVSNLSIALSARGAVVVLNPTDDVRIVDGLPNTNDNGSGLLSVYHVSSNS